MRPCSASCVHIITHNPLHIHYNTMLNIHTHPLGMNRHLKFHTFSQISDHMDESNINDTWLFSHFHTFLTRFICQSWFFLPVHLIHMTLLRTSRLFSFVIYFNMILFYFDSFTDDWFIYTFLFLLHDFYFHIKCFMSLIYFHV